MAQTDIQFSILKAEADGMSASVTNALDLKLRQVFDRNGAGAADLYNVFAIEPTISVEKIISTKDGVVLDVPIAQGELVLIAKNIIDGALPIALSYCRKQKHFTTSSVTKKLLAISLLPLPISHAMIRLTLCRSKFLQSWAQSQTL